MTMTTIIDGVAGILQLLVAVYALRLHRAFGMARVGWSLFCAFGLLALLHFTQAAAIYAPNAAAGLGSIFLLVPLLLFVGMMHLETMLQKRALQEQVESQRRAELELEVKKKTAYLMRAMEGLDSEMAERKRMETKVTCLTTIQPRLFDSFAEMLANIPTQSIIRVLTEESYMLGVDLTQQRQLLSTEVGSILVFSQFVGAGGKCPHPILKKVELPAAHVECFRQIVARLTITEELPRTAGEEFEKIFGGSTVKPKVSQPLLPPIPDPRPDFELAGLAHC